MKTKKIKIGIFGTGRGVGVAVNLMQNGAEIVAICENRPERLEKAYEKLGKDIAVYEDFDKFIEHDMDAVVIANFFHEHAPYAIKCLEKGIHVYSECLSNGTMAEGVALVRAAEKSKAIYMQAENFPNMLFNREMKRVYEGGTLGKLLYAEGEYNHPSSLDEYCRINYSETHWRNQSPVVQYLTHSLGPLMAITGATPKRVVTMAAFAPETGDVPVPTLNADQAGIMLTQNDDGSVFRFTGCSRFGGGACDSYRICGTKGSIENIRGMGEQVMLRYNRWDTPEGAKQTKLYTPEWNVENEELVKQSDHGGSDFITASIFLDCVKKGVQPPMPYDVYSATLMASVAHLAHRSMLEGARPYDIPDFRREEDRKQYENDYLSIFAPEGSPNHLPCCSHPDYKPTDTQRRLYLDLLAEKAKEAKKQ
ncbi:MAG: Gfo/Idh/MocA family oxidoreductase [Clostridia bacterium]|nr:Gfo/Idh/MocA family oxidoreductase [Clostridia bacterium]